MQKITGGKILMAAMLALGAGLPAHAATTPAASTTPAPAASAALTDAQKAEIQSMIKDYVAGNGQAIVESVKSWQEQQQQQQEASAQANIKKEHEKLFADPGDPVLGNPKGDVTIVQFYDYNCHYCKGVAPVLTQLLGEDKNLRIVYKQFPILGQSSMMASQAVLAVNKQGKFAEFHNALMKNNEPLTEDRLVEIAKGIKGIDVAKMKADANSDAISKEISATVDLGQEIGVHGTPGFVIADQLYPGAMGIDQFKDLIAKARNKSHSG